MLCYGPEMFKLCSEHVCNNVMLCGCGGLVMNEFYTILVKHWQKMVLKQLKYA